MERPGTRGPVRVNSDSKRQVRPASLALLIGALVAGAALLQGCASATPADLPSDPVPETTASTPQAKTPTIVEPVVTDAKPSQEAWPQPAPPPERWSDLLRAGRTHLSLGELAEAEDSWTRAYDLTADFWPRDPRTATTIRNLQRLATAYRKAGDAAGFGRVMELLAYVSQENPSYHTPEMAVLMQELAAIRTLQGRPAEARDALERTIVLVGEDRGPKDPSLVGLHAQLGLALLELDDLEGAEREIDHAAEIATLAAGPDSVLFAKSLVPRAKLEFARGNVDDSRDALLAAIDISEEHNGENAPATARVVRELALFEQNAGDNAAAERSFDRAIAIWDALPRESYQRAQSRNELAWFRVETGQAQRAERPARSALGILEKSRIAGQPLAAVSDTLATALRDQAKYEEAERLYQQALTEGKRNRDLPGWNVSEIAERYAVLLEQTDRRAEAEELRARWQD